MRTLFLLTLSIFALSAEARNLRLEQPISAAVDDATFQQKTLKGYTLIFGASNQAEKERVVHIKKTHNYSRPFFYSPAKGGMERREDSLTCNEALRNLVIYAISYAEEHNAKTIVMNSTEYDGQDVADPQRNFVCNAGMNSAVVEGSFSIYKDKK